MKTLKGPLLPESDPREKERFIDPTVGDLRRFDVNSVTVRISPEYLNVPKIQNSLISGLRLVQLATGSQ